MILAPGYEAPRRLRLRGQLLDEPPKGRGPRDPAAVAAALVGVQAQDLLAAALSIRARTEGLVMADVEAAASDPLAHSLALTWSLRGTRHLHDRGDVRWLVGLLGPVFSRPGVRAEQLGIAGRVGERAVAVLADVLASGVTLTRRQVAELLAGYGVDPDTRAPIHVIRRAALEGILCIIPGPGGNERQERYVALDAWLGPVADESPRPDGTGAELVRRYLAGFGPARAADFAAWSGLTTAVVAASWQAVSGEMEEVVLPGGPAWTLPGSAEPREPAPPRLLGGFDNLLLGYRDRSLHLDPLHARAVNAGGGLIKPVAVVDGVVVATWKLRRRRSTLGTDVEVTALASAPPGVDLAAEIADVERFLARPRTYAGDTRAADDPALPCTTTSRTPGAEASVTD